jgi:hypothetical protein
MTDDELTKLLAARDLALDALLATPAQRAFEAHRVSPAPTTPAELTAWYEAFEVLAAGVVATPEYVAFIDAEEAIWQYRERGKTL